MHVSVVNARNAPSSVGLKQVMEAHSEMPGSVLHVMAGEVLRLEEYSAHGVSPHDRNGQKERFAGGMTSNCNSDQKLLLFPTAFFIGDVEAAVASAAAAEATAI